MTQILTVWKDFKIQILHRPQVIQVLYRLRNQITTNLLADRKIQTTFLERNFSVMAVIDRMNFGIIFYPTIIIIYNYPIASSECIKGLSPRYNCRHMDMRGMADIPYLKPDRNGDMHTTAIQNNIQFLNVVCFFKGMKKPEIKKLKHKINLFLNKLDMDELNQNSITLKGENFTVSIKTGLCFKQLLFRPQTHI